MKFWQYQLLDGASMATEDGESINIIYPGRLNDEAGADFRDAVIATSRGLSRGDVELHVNSGDWRSHRHHLDPVYNRVILHAVMWHNSRTGTRLQNGREVPVLALHKYIKTPAGRLPDSVPSPAALSTPCIKAVQRLNINAVLKFLDRAGEERFLDKAARFQRDLARMGTGQAFYQGIMGALGYARNKLPFLELARMLPLRIMEAVIRDRISGRDYLARNQALLLGTAGLLQTLCLGREYENGLDGKRINELARIWNSSCHPSAMPSGAWKMFKVRPNNSPLRRLIAMSYLLLRYREKGLLEGMTGLVTEVPLKRGHRGLEAGLMVSTGGCRIGHSASGSGGEVGSLTLLGRGRAADVVVNVLLPFIFAWSQANSRPELGNKAFDLYRLYPGLVVNSVEKHMSEQLGLNRSLANSARCQQGLIHIYNKLCSQGKCRSCFLSQLEAGDHVQFQAANLANQEPEIAAGRNHGGVIGT